MSEETESFDFNQWYNSQLEEMRDATIRAGISALAQRVHKTAVDHGWWEDEDGPNGVERNMGEMIALMHSELSEALESVRSGEDHLFYVFKDGGMPMRGNAPEMNGVLGKPEGIASEFADTIIRIMDTCEKRGIPLAEAIIRKAAYNDTRPYKHGGRAF